MDQRLHNLKTNGSNIPTVILAFVIITSVWSEIITVGVLLPFVLMLWSLQSVDVFPTHLYLKMVYIGTFGNQCFAQTAFRETEIHLFPLDNWVRLYKMPRLVISEIKVYGIIQGEKHILAYLLQLCMLGGKALIVSCPFLRILAALAFQYSLNISFCKVFIYYMKSAKG